MKKLVYLTSIVLFAMILGACAKATPQPVQEMINPGDKIGGFLITTWEEGDVTYIWDVDCDESNEANYSCKSTVGTKVSISAGIYDDTRSGKLDDYWSNHTYELFIENRPVNLQAFGFRDINHPAVGKMRLWNVMIIAAKPGDISFHDSGVVNGDPFGWNHTLIFNAP